MKLVLPDTIASAQDLNTVLNDVHTYAKWVAKESIKHKVSGKSTSTPPEVSSEANEVLRSWGNGKPLSQANLDTLTKVLEDYKKSAPTITITLAAVPSGEVKSSLVAWCRKEISPRILVSFRMNRNILGGMVVAYGSHIHDWSFRRKLMHPQQQFAEVLARV